MEKSKDRLTSLQVSIFVASTLIGVGILTLPRSVTMDAGVGGVISLTIAGVIIATASLILSKLSQRFPDQNVVEMSQMIIGKIPGTLLSGILVFYFIITTGTVLRLFGGVLKVFLLRNTPLEVIMITMLLVVMYLVQHGIQPLVRICEAFFPVLLFALFILLIFPVADFRMNEFRPMLAEGIMPILKGLPGAILTFIGVEVIFFVCPYMEKQKNLVKASLIGVGITFAIYMAVLVITLAAFGVELTQHFMYPTLSLARYVTFPGAFLERFDILFVAFWIITVFTTIAAYYYMAGFTLTRLIGYRNFKPMMYGILPLVYIVAILPRNMVEIFQWADYISYIGGFIVIFLPGMLYLISVVRRKGEDVGSKG